MRPHSTSTFGLLVVALLLVWQMSTAQSSPTSEPAPPNDTAPKPSDHELTLFELMEEVRPPQPLLKLPPSPQPQPIIRQQIRRYVSKLKRCYENSLKSRPDLSGRLVLTWEIDARGRVVDARILSSTLDAPDLEQCILRTIQTFRFHADTPQTSVEQSFVFAPAS
ncbi:MAG: AgmX/PglI C-terminal domain-containing protein [Myxococcota bacterium]